MKHLTSNFEFSILTVLYKNLSTKEECTKAQELLKCFIQDDLDSYRNFFELQARIKEDEEQQQEVLNNQV